MADKDKTEEDQPSIKPVAELKVPQIIAALHQNAVEKSKTLLGSELRLVNSAVDDSGDSVKLTSTGQHIISVIPTEEAAKKKIDLSKKTAIEVLKTYVQWFVGPDLAKKVNDKTVKSLNESPENNEDKKNDDEKLDENSKSFMKFSQFLKEAEDDDDVDFGDESDSRKPAAEDVDDPEFGDEDKPEDKKPDENKDKDKNDNIDPNIGYYITYDLKVEGMKKQAKLDDSMKSMGKSIRNYFATFFDDFKITASGLFGGGDSFTVKDIKDKFRSAFGPINPDELVRNVSERLELLFKGSSPHAEVKVQDQQTLISDLGTFINGKQKQQIETADYSLFIRVDQDDPKKPILNRGKIADIVQASIKGLYKKFKNRISKDDVIYIENYQDIHANTEKIRALYAAVPSPNKIKDEIDKSPTANAALSKIQNILRRISKDKDKDDCDRANKCVNVWLKFNEQNNTDDKDVVDKLSKLSNNTKKFKEFFQPFIDAYSKAYKSTENKDLNESKTFVFNFSSMKKHMLQMMFESYLHEDGKDTPADDLAKIDIAKLVSKCIKLLDNYDIFNRLRHDQLMCMSKDSIRSKLSDFDISNLESDFGDFKNGILICEQTSLLNESNFTSNAIKNSIMDILFEDDIPEDNVDIGKLHNALKSALAEFGVTDVANKVFSYKLKSLDDHKPEDTPDEKPEDKPEDKPSDDGPDFGDLDEAEKPEDKSKKKKKQKTAYVLPFGKDELKVPDSMPSPTSGFDGKIDDNDKNRNELYIIPMPGLKYEDPEYANRNLT